MNFMQMRYIVEIVETGSMSKAAGNLYVSQPSLSRQIKSLEDELKQPIFERTNKGVKLTGFGVEVYYKSKEVVDQFHMAHRAILGHSESKQNRIASFGSEVIHAAFMRICNAYMDQGIQFEFLECGADQTIEHVAQRRCDMGLVLCSELQEKKMKHLLRSEGLSFENLFQGQLTIHMHQSDPLSFKSMLRAEDLKEHIHVQKSYLFSGLFSLEYEMRALGIGHHNTLKTNNLQTYNEGLRTLKAFGLEVNWSCNKKVDGPLRRIFFEQEPILVQCLMIYRNQIDSEVLSAFRDELIHAYG